MNKAYLVAAGELNLEFLKYELKNKKNEELLICVDAGLKYLDEICVLPDIILGDFDSIDKVILEKYLKLDIQIEKYNPIKDYSDTELAIDLCKSKGYDDISIFAALGKRMDHSLSNIYLCCSYLEKGLKISLLDEYNKIYVANKSFSIKKNEQYGKYISFYPMNGAIEKLSLSGFRYNLDNISINKYQNPSLTLSNEIILDEAYISFDRGLLLVIESRDRWQSGL